MRMFPTAADNFAVTHPSGRGSNEPCIDLEMLLRTDLPSTDSADEYVVKPRSYLSLSNKTKFTYGQKS